MTILDSRGYEISGASPAERDTFERTLSLQMNWQQGTDIAVQGLIAQAPRSLFRRARGDAAAALTLYDRHIAQGEAWELSDLIDASGLLWRLKLDQVDAGLRWEPLADAWAARVEDGYCTFSDIHAMVAFMGARNWKAATQLEAHLSRSRLQGTRYGETTRLVGLPVCRRQPSSARYIVFDAARLRSAHAASRRPRSGLM